MIRVIMSGCCGHMGRVVTEIIEEQEGMEIVAGVDVFDSGDRPYPVFASPADCDVEADVLVDFSSVNALDGLLAYCVEKQVPAVLCTTGYTQEQLDQITAASEKVAILKSANMSLGINLLSALLKEAAKVLSPAGFDIEIVEKHHNRKLDAPSGTAIALADSINEALDGSCEYTYDRSQEKKRREKNEIGISSVRGGTIVGEHEVIFAGLDEVIEFKHTAYSRSIFAKGAVQAAAFLAGKPAGYYGMDDVICLQK
ncbi:MAG: 4-hydroxy-tetrahydrodipicolinate reductase [Lachnospiraceae bacterium]|nr:4-hydroxy-tetrahydrodipicolinate reductase [Lachnospiraceae bacterium]